MNPVRVGIALIVLLLPLLFATNYQLFQLTLTISTALAILGLNLVTGYTGQISLGHGGFYAIGAYVTAILMADFNVPYWATLPVSALICAGAGYLIALPALRVGGLYLALITLALASAVPQILKFKGLEDWTGGVQGVFISKPPAPFGLPLSPDQYLYLFSLAVAGLLFGLAYNLVRGRMGLAMMAIRDQPLAAEAAGINLARVKTRTFAISAMMTGVAGSLSAIAVEFVSPDSFQVLLSIFLFVGLVVGGVGSLLGPIFGAIFVQFVPNIADEISKAAPGAVYGVALILVLWLMPAGIAGALRQGLLALSGRVRGGRLTDHRRVHMPDPVE
jgi:branched-chain amino acid transport system permease protein